VADAHVALQGGDETLEFLLLGRLVTASVEELVHFVQAGLEGGDQLLEGFDFEAVFFLAVDGGLQELSDKDAHAGFKREPVDFGT